MQLKKFLPLALGAVASAQNLTDVLASQNSSLSALSSLLATNPTLVSALSSASNITILAPNNEAISTFLNSSTGKTAATNPGLVTALLTYHVLNGSYSASAFTNTSQFLPTLLTNEAYANVTGGQRVEARLNGSSVEIFSGLLAKSTVVTADLNFTGGVLHIIDTVLTIPESDAATAAAANLTALTGALTQANLVSTVDSLHDVTIFAPSNAAFQAIGSAVGTLTTAQLASILEYHVINGTVGYAPSLTNTTLTTVGGGSVTITVENGTVFVNSAKVIIPDVLVANGVVHVIDGVLNPNNTSAAPNPTTTSAAFSGASSATDVPFTSGVSQGTTVSETPSRPLTTSSSSAGAGGFVRAMPTGMVEMGALLGGAAVFAAGL
ncbi:Fasciclin-domain-containing protein [Stipitochalara longipes BDJ]|nr:Fasciclin-domain-containing protein [Stipitochalara longipes BDJ]